MQSGTNLSQMFNDEALEHEEQKAQLWKLLRERQCVEYLSQLLQVDSIEEQNIKLTAETVQLSNSVADLKKENTVLRMFNTTEWNTRIENTKKDRIDHMTNIAFGHAMESKKLNIIAAEAAAEAFKE